MKETVDALRQTLRTGRPADWAHLPDIPLYMDQVLSYMDRQLIQVDGDDALTAAMVNNYTKNSLLPRARGKKYDKEHLAYLTAICVLKQVMPARDIDLLLREELQGDLCIEDGYAAFCGSLDGALNATADGMRDCADAGDLADQAIHFALLAYAARLVSRRYLNLLREERPAEEKRRDKAAKQERGRKE